MRSKQRTSSNTNHYVIKVQSLIFLLFVFTTRCNIWSIPEEEQKRQCKDNIP